MSGYVISGMKCPKCEDSNMERRKHPTGSTWPPGNAFYVPYYCGSCKISYAYCVVCLITIKADVFWLHRENIHDSCSKFYSVDSSKHYKIYCESKYVQSYMRNEMMSLHDSATHLYMMIVQNACKYYSPDGAMPILYHGAGLSNYTENEMDEILDRHLFDNNYSCKFCNMFYDSIPTESMVHGHLRVCEYTCYVRETMLKKSSEGVEEKDG